MPTREVINPLDQILGWLGSGVQAVQDFGWSSPDLTLPSPDQVDKSKEAALSQLVGNIEDTPERVAESTAAAAKELERSIPAAQEQLTKNVEEVVPKEIDRSTYASQAELSENTGGFIPRPELNDMPSHDPVNMADAQQLQAESLAKRVTDQAKMELETGVNGQGSEDVDRKWWSMLGAALKGVGKPLSMTFEAWQGLSPSTKVALIGSAGTVWAYNKGWGKTAGDIAQGTAGLYGTLATNESTVDAAKQKALLTAQQEATGDNQAQANKDREFRLKQLAAAEPSQQQLDSFGKTPAILKAADLKAGFFGGGDKEENASLLTNVIHSIWRSKAAKGDIDPLKTGFATFATRQDVIDAALGYIKEQGGINLK